MDFSTLVLAAVFLSLAMAAAFAVRRATGKSGWIDAIWSAAIGIAGVVVALAAPAAAGGRHWLVAGVVLAWSARLAVHIAGRTRSGGDDPRYVALEREWGPSASRRLALFLQIQAGVGWILVMAIGLAATNPAPFPGLVDWIGTAVVAVAIAGEAVADDQLRAFRADASEAGSICEIGLWRWSRHPNYFFEWLGWVGLAVLAIDPTGARPLGLLAVVAPVLMYALLVHASGIPPLEAHMAATRGEAWRAYQSRVSAFFPRPRRAPSP